MAIAVAIQRGDGVYVYDERNHFLMNKPGKLVGYTSNTVSVEFGGVIHTFDAKGRVVSSQATFKRN
jgi:hypothetical protein